MSASRASCPWEVISSFQHMPTGILRATETIVRPSAFVRVETKDTRKHVESRFDLRRIPDRAGAGRRRNGHRVSGTQPRSAAQRGAQGAQSRAVQRRGFPGSVHPGSRSCLGAGPSQHRVDPPAWRVRRPAVDRDAVRGRHRRECRAQSGHDDAGACRAHPQRSRQGAGLCASARSGPPRHQTGEFSAVRTDRSRRAGVVGGLWDCARLRRRGPDGHRIGDGDGGLRGA